MNKIGYIKLAQWLFATVAITVSTTFAVMRFAYSDFETTRNDDIYRTQIEKRLERIDADLVEIDRKVDRILLHNQK